MLGLLEAVSDAGLALEEPPSVPLEPELPASEEAAVDDVVELLDDVPRLSVL